MAADVPQGFPRVTPYLLYEDVAAALDWLAAAFGFRERLRFAAPDGTVNHAEMAVGDDGVVMLGHPGSEYRNPRRLGAWTSYMHVYVEDIDAHHARAREAGATIVRDLNDEEYGDRRYDAEDPEGHRWSFAQRVRDVPPAQWGGEHGGRVASSDHRLVSEDPPRALAAIASRQARRARARRGGAAPSVCSTSARRP